MKPRLDLSWSCIVLAALSGGASFAFIYGADAAYWSLAGVSVACLAAGVVLQLRER